MKNLKIAVFLSLTLLMAFSVPKISSAQVIGYTLGAYTPEEVHKANDTAVNADTTYLQITTGDSALHQYEDVVYEWSVVASITGTTAGTVIAQGSETGIFSNSGDWVTLVSDVTQYDGSSSISVGATNITGYFILPNVFFKYVRLRYITSGTQTSSITGTAYIKPHS